MADIPADAYLVAVPDPVFGGATVERQLIAARELGKVGHVVEAGGVSGAKTGQLWPRQ